MIGGLNRIEVSRLSITADSDVDVQHLVDELLSRQPEAKPLLQRLRQRVSARGFGAFAPITSRRCPACNLIVATASLQQARAGEFINCPSCSRFLFEPAAA
jgi:predicted  nucleic acid-binding Zn-ribbon protein